METLSPRPGGGVLDLGAPQFSPKRRVDGWPGSGVPGLAAPSLPQPLRGLALAAPGPLACRAVDMIGSKDAEAPQPLGVPAAPQLRASRGAASHAPAPDEPLHLVVQALQQELLALKGELRSLRDHDSDGVGRTGERRRATSPCALSAGAVDAEFETLATAASELHQSQSKLLREQVSALRADLCSLRRDLFSLRELCCAHFAGLQARSQELDAAAADRFAAVEVELVARCEELGVVRDDLWGLRESVGREIQDLQAWFGYV